MMLCILALIATASAGPWGQLFKGEKVFRVQPKNEEQVKIIATLTTLVQLDFWKPESSSQISPNMVVDFHAAVDEASFVQYFLRKSGIEYEVLIDDLQMAIEKQLDSQYSGYNHSYEKYNTWDKVVAWTAQMASTYSSLVTREEIGNSYKGRPMYVLKLGKSSTSKKTAFIECGIHAREWISPAFCQWFVNEAVRTYETDKTMNRLLSKMTIYVLPVFNVDGYVYTWTNVCGFPYKRYVELERALIKEVTTFYDLKLLEKYIKTSVTPRGLRVERLPAFEFSDDELDLSAEWKDISVKCTLGWLGVLVKRNERTLNKTRSSILLLQDKLIEESSVTVYNKNMVEIKNSVSKIEAEVVSRKKRKYLRDIKDHETGKLFSWQYNFKRRGFRDVTRGPRSIGGRKPLLLRLMVEQQKSVSFESLNLEQEARVGASKSPCSETYCGSSPESEIETKNVVTFIRKHISTMKAYISVHSYSQLLMFPYGFTYNHVANYKILNTIAGKAVSQLTSLYNTAYRYGAVAETIYPAAGASLDWAYEEGIKYSFVFELRDTGRYGFLLPESEIKPTCEETMVAVKYILKYVLLQ
ncbi:carboxypeptidase B-like [Protopterus annectens]|uniref:carboxypeptidase B-like n=1 Tax=Protopterus annectens TaxID=7888 RepID=UPI001CFAFC07|nr:carboxypeptidase B-like [Protopterus annectens]